MKKIAIIGGGLSGTVVAMRLLEQKKPVEVVLFERVASQLFRGIAYSSALKLQPLNVRAKQMNLWSAKPGHFYSWMDEHRQNYLEHQPSQDEFIRRDAFGDYVESQFKKTLETTDNRFSVVVDEITAINGGEKAFNLVSAKSAYSADVVILALGNFLPGDVPISNNDFYHSDQYQSNPWDIRWMERLDADAPVLFVGSGLTTVDQIINLLHNGHRGKITIMSRRGFVPKPHYNYDVVQLPPLPVLRGMAILDVVKMIRTMVKRYEPTGVDWRNVIDTVRHQVPEIWAALPTEERKRFLRHVRPFWEVHRHRIPENSYQIISKKVESGQIAIIAGRLIDITNEEQFARVEIRRRGEQSPSTIMVKKVVNCTGPQSDFRKIGQPLIVDLLQKGWLQTDELGLGLSVNSQGQPLNKDGNPVTNLYTIGSLRKGAMWECTALREIVMQADELSSRID